MPNFYFAYGSNMSAQQMALRCPGAKPHGVAVLPGWEFIINQIGAAALRPSAAGQMYGVLWQCTARHLADLDRYEGVAQQVYQRQHLRLSTLRTGSSVMATVYVATDQLAGAAPVPGYVEHAILPGAREFTLPQTYIEELSTWLPGGSAYPDPSVRRTSTYRFGKKKPRKFTGWGGQK